MQSWTKLQKANETTQLGYGLATWGTSSWGEIWNNIITTVDTWTKVNKSSDNWTPITKDNNTWTSVSKPTNSWTKL